MKHIHSGPEFQFLYDDVQRDGICDALIDGRPHDTFLHAVYDRHVTRESVVVEAGAHVGTHTLLLSKRAAKVLAFEPQLPLYLQLCANLWLNDCRNVEPVHTALFSRACDLKPNVHEEHYWQSPAKSGLSFSPTGNPADFLTVAARTLDSYALARLDLLKIDAEWNDLQVAKGGVETIARCRPVIVFEEGGNEDIGPWHALLDPLGYAISRIEQSNFLAVPASRL